jgi:ribosome biogenesis GTPase A
MDMARLFELRVALDRLEELADGSDHDTVAGLRDRLDSSRLRVVVAGEAKRGKSTLVNALLGRDVLPTGVIPLTAVPTTVVQASAGEGVEVAFAGGRSRWLPLSAVPDFCTERGNPGNCRNVSAITVGLDAQILARGVEIVDMPGMGSVHAQHRCLRRGPAVYGCGDLRPDGRPAGVGERAGPAASRSRAVRGALRRAEQG